ncbi:hypothetical protein DB346_05840 [Verrucomicrobia bacterium LW23]|nr:hypothetical protein DB346_05840 [Verrucomicrobia bacterium LW23]
MSQPATSPRILHVFTSAESAADGAAVRLIEEQKASAATAAAATAGGAAPTISTLVLTPENSREALAALFAADRITTWPGTPSA